MFGKEVNTHFPLPLSARLCVFFGAEKGGSLFFPFFGRREVGCTFFKSYYYSPYVHMYILIIKIIPLFRKKKKKSSTLFSLLKSFFQHEKKNLLR